MAHPRPGETARSVGDVTVVIPVRDRADGLAVTLQKIGSVDTIVVDDGSSDDSVAHAVDGGGVTMLRNEHALGPAAARNVGWRHATTELVAFLDAGCEPADDWLERLLPHFDDTVVGAVAPRITTTIPTTLPPALARYEEARPSLDRGGQEATVRPRSPVPFVPTAALVVRRQLLAQTGGFDERMRFGEDVDLVWRLVAAGWTVRYEPATAVAHPARPTGRAWLRQRFDYGTSAAPLARRHGSAVAPLAVSPWSALAWALVGMGEPVAGCAVGAGTTALLAPRLAGLQHPGVEALRLAGKGHLYAGLSVAVATRRAWWPLAAVAGVMFRRARPALVAAATVPALLEWCRRRPALDPARWAAVALIDDAAYGAGLWVGCLRERSLVALRPDLVLWPGRRPAVES